MPFCKGCQTEKPTEEFHKGKNPGGIAYRCKACVSEYSRKRRFGPKREEILRKEKESDKRNRATQKAWYAKNAERLRKYAREYSAKRRQSEEWRIKRREYLEANAESISQYRENYRKNNTAKFASYVRATQMEKLNRVPPYIRAEVTEVYAMLREEALRLEALTGEKYEVDHIVPIRAEFVSGLHVPWNLQVISKLENLAKNNRVSSKYGWVLDEEDKEELRQNAIAAGLKPRKGNSRLWQ